MAVFCHKTSIDTLRKRMPAGSRNSMLGGGLGSTDVTSRPQTIDQQPKAKQKGSPLPGAPVTQNSAAPVAPKSFSKPIAAPEQSVDDSMSKNSINLSEDQLLKMLEEA